MGLYKRGDVWWIDITYRGKRVRCSTETRSRRLAGEIHAKVMTELIEDKWFDKLPGEKITFRVMMERYRKEKFSKLASSSRLGCGSYLKGLVAYFGDYHLSEITPSLVSKFKAMRFSRGVKPATVNRQLTIMKRAYNVAIREWEWARENPVAKVPSERVTGMRDRWVSSEEERRLLTASPSWMKEIVVFALYTGMRRGEILELQWKDVDLVRKTITVVKSKNYEMRTIPMNRTVFDLLKAKSKVKALRTDLVFHTSNQTPIHPNNVRRDFARALKRANLTDLRFHDLRHTFATRLTQAGEDLYRIARLLGHKDVKTTQRYAHHYPESLRGSVEILDGLRHKSDTISLKTHSHDLKKADK